VANGSPKPVGKVQSLRGMPLIKGEKNEKEKN